MCNQQEHRKSCCIYEHSIHKLELSEHISIFRDVTWTSVLPNSLPLCITADADQGTQVFKYCIYIFQKENTLYVMHPLAFGEVQHYIVRMKQFTIRLNY